jgi:hypothetical protein
MPFFEEFRLFEGFFIFPSFGAKTLKYPLFSCNCETTVKTFHTACKRIPDMIQEKKYARGFRDSRMFI